MDPMIMKVVMFFPAFLFSLSFHEFAHGYVAKLRGDNTAEMMGRLTLDPLAHIDWIGTVALPIVSIISGLPLFGWAKPVPVNPRNLRDQKNDMFWVALAGPMSNILLFIVGLIVYGVAIAVFHVNLNKSYMGIVFVFLYLNLLLAFFNLLPLHPLDGGKILERFIPYNWNRWLLDHQYHLNIALLLLFISGGFYYLAYPIQYIVVGSLDLVRGVVL